MIQDKSTLPTSGFNAKWLLYLFARSHKLIRGVIVTVLLQCICFCNINAQSSWTVQTTATPPQGSQFNCQTLYVSYGASNIVGLVNDSGGHPSLTQPVGRFVATVGAPNTAPADGFSYWVGSLAIGLDPSSGQPAAFGTTWGHGGQSNRPIYKLVNGAATITDTIYNGLKRTTPDLDPWGGFAFNSVDGKLYGIVNNSQQQSADYLVFRMDLKTGVVEKQAISLPGATNALQSLVPDMFFDQAGAGYLGAKTNADPGNNSWTLYRVDFTKSTWVGEPFINFTGLNSFFFYGAAYLNGNIYLGYSDGSIYPIPFQRNLQGINLTTASPHIANYTTGIETPPNMSPSIDGFAVSDLGSCALAPVPPVQPKFTCTSTIGYLIQDTVANAYEVNIATGAFKLVKAGLINDVTKREINAIGYNVTDNYLWGHRPNTNQLVRIGSDWSVELITIPGLPATGNFFVGDISRDGVLYLAGTPSRSEMYRVDVNPSSATYLQLLPTLPMTSSNITDWAFSPVDNNLYAIINNDGSADAYKLFRFNPATGARTDLGKITGGGIQNAANITFGAAYMDNTGALYVSANETGNIYRIANPHTGGVTSIFVAKGPVSANNDGARCPLTPIVLNPPAAVNDTAFTDVNIPVSVRILTNDIKRDYPIDTNSVVITTQPQHGSITVGAGGVLLYTPANGYAGTDSLKYTVSDTTRTVSNIATVFITVQPPFVCSPVLGYLIQDVSGAPAAYEVNLASGTATLVKSNMINDTVAKSINAIGYNIKDNYIWGQRPGTNQIVRIGSDWSVSLFTIAGLPANGVNVGDVSSAGVLYLYSTATTVIYRVDVNPASPTYLQRLPNLTTTSSGIADWAFNPVDGNLYSISAGTGTGDAPFQLLRFNPANGARTIIGVISGGGIQVDNTNPGFGAVYMDNEGSLYVSNNTSGKIYRVRNTHTGGLVAEFMANGPTSGGNDGARCPLAPVAGVPPKAVNDTAATMANIPVLIDILANDSAITSPLNKDSVAIITQPQHGTVTIDTSGRITYTPASGFTGMDSLTYTIKDSADLVSNIATVYITINPPKTADVAIVKYGPATVTPNGSISYKLYVTNAGPAAVNNVVVVDSAVANFTADSVICVAGSGTGGAAGCPATLSVASLQGTGLIIPTLPAGSAITFTITGTAGATGSISNTAAVKVPGDVTDSIPGNNRSTVVTVITPACTGTETVYLLDPQATLAAAGTIAPDGGIVNLVFSLSSGTAIPGIGNSFMVPVQYSDFNQRYTGSNHTWSKFVVYPSTAWDNVSSTQAFGIVPNHPGWYAGLSANNTAQKPVTSPNITDVFFSTYLANGNLNQLGTFNITIGSLPTPPAGVTLVSDTIRILSTNNLSTNGNGNNQAGYWMKPIAQTGMHTFNATAQTDPLVVPYGNTYTYRYSAFTNGSVTPGADRGVVIDYGKVIFCTPLSVPPVAVNDSTSTPLNTPVTISVLANDSAKTYPIDSSSIIITQQPKHGTATANPNGTVTYTPANNYAGQDTLIYTVKDTSGLVSNPATVVIKTPGVVPSPLDDAGTTPANTPVTIPVLANDGGPLDSTSVTIVTPPAHGTPVVNPDGTITYTPNPGYSGIDTLTYTVKSPDGTTSVPVKVVITVTPPPVPPVAVNDSTATPLNTPVTIPVLSNDSTKTYPIDSSSIIITQQPKHGTATVNPNGTVTYTPANNYAGLDTLLYTVKDTSGLVSNPATVVIKTLGVVPSPLDDAGTTPANTPVTIPVLDNDGGPLDSTSVTIATPPAHGTVVVNPDGTVTYTPTPGYSGRDTLTYTVKSPDGTTSVPVKVVITVTPPPVPPVAVNDSTSTPLNTPVTIPVLSNDSTKTYPIDSSSIIITQQPKHGTATVNPNGTVTYTPANNYAGLDTLIYTVKDTSGLVSNPATVVIKVPGVAPSPLDDTGTTEPGTPVAIPVLDNDGGPLDSTSVTIATPPAHGTVVVNPDGTVTYTPTPGYSGTDTLTYTVKSPDGTTSVPVKVVITVTAPPVPPVAVDDAAITPAGTPVNIPVLGNDTAKTNPIDPATIVITQQPKHGTATVNPNGTVTYTPVNNYAGQDTLIYTVKDTSGLVSNPASVVIKVPGVAPSPLDDTGTTKPGTPVTIPVLDNDGGPLDSTSVTIATPPAHGTAVVNPDGTVTYTPTPGYSGTDTLTYTVKSPDGSTSVPVKVVITVTAPPVPPVAVDDAATTPAGTPVNIPVLGNDTAKTNPIDPATIVITQQPKHGTATVNPNGTVTYTPAPGYSGPDDFKYTVKDNSGITSNPAAVTISVTPVIAPPVAQKDSSSTVANTPVVIPVIDNDSDSIGIDRGSIIITEQPKHGTVTVNPDGTITYTPDRGYTGSDSLKYIIKNISGISSSPATVVLTVQSETLNIPNALSPNGDGKNDRFIIRGLERYQGVILDIYNRWGNQVYHAANYSNNWDGNGLNEGTYYYILKVKDATGEKAYKGWILLVR